MVLDGQFLERPALVACGDLVLEGLSHRGRRAPALLVCPPLEGGGMDAAAVAELAWASARAGHPSLRFQHRGVGASQGEPDAALAVDDAAAALAHLAEGGPGWVAVAGVGSGCATALALAARLPRALCGLALVGPGAVALRGLGAMAGAKGPRPAGSGGRGEPVVAARSRGWSGPVLVVLAEGGRAPPRSTLPAGARVERIPGADPAFRSGLPGTGRTVAEWLAALATRP